MKLLRISLLIACLSIFSFAQDMKNEEFTKLKAFKDIQANITGNHLIAKDLDLYLVKGVDGRGQPFSIVTDKTGRYLFLTENVFDTKTQKQITIPVDVSALKDKELFTYGTGSKEYYVFTDPECPYCHKFEASWGKIKDKVKLHVFFFNLDFHKNANAMGRWILSATSDAQKAERLSAVGKGDTTYKSFKLSKAEETKLNKMMADTKALGMKIGVQGTPAVFDTQGNVINWPTLIK